MTTLHLDPASRPRNASGQVMPYATLTFLRSGTEQVIATYTADAAGEFAEITPDFEAYTFRVQLREASGVLRYDVDPYLPAEGQTVYYDAQIQAVTDGEIVPGAELIVDGEIFADPDLTRPLPNPITADASGLFRAIYLDVEPPEELLVLEVDAYEAGGPITFSWSENPEATEYRLHLISSMDLCASTTECDEFAAEDLLYWDTIPAPTLTYTIEELAGLAEVGVTGYYFVVYAYDGESQIQQSNIIGIYAT